MNNIQIKAGATDVSVVIRIIDSADGTPETGVVYNTSGIDLQYRRELAASTAITEADLAALTTAHADGGFKHIGNGYYRLDLPDAAVAAGAPGVLIHGIVTGMVVIGCYIQLVAFDPFDAVRLGLTALPNAAAEAAGGLYTRGSGAGQLSQSANGELGITTLAKTLTTYTGNTPQTGDVFPLASTEIADIKAKTDNLPTDPADESLIIAATDAIMSRLGVAGAGLTALGDTRIANLDAAVTTRMATFSLPTNFAALSITAAGLVDITQAAADKVWSTAARTLTSFGSLVADVATAVWGAATRLLTAGTNIVLAKDVGVTGFNDISAAQVNAEADTAIADYDGPTNAELVTALGTADDVVLAAISALNNLSSAQVATALATYAATQPTESYAADSAVPTRDQFLFMIYSLLATFAFTGTTQSIKKLDKTTQAMTFAIDSAVTPTSHTRTG